MVWEHGLVPSWCLWSFYQVGSEGGGDELSYLAFFDSFGISVRVQDLVIEVMFMVSGGTICLQVWHGDDGSGAMGNR